MIHSKYYRYVSATVAAWALCLILPLTVMAAGEIAIYREATAGENYNSGIATDVLWDTTVREDAPSFLRAGQTVTLVRGGHYFLGWSMVGDTAGGANRAKLEGRLELNGTTPLAYGRGWGYLRDSSTSLESYAQGATIINVNANETVKLQVFRQDSNTAAQQWQRRANTSGMTLLKLNDNWPFAAYRETGGGQNLWVAEAAKVVVDLDVADEEDAGFSHDGNGSITLANAGYYLVAFNIGLNSSGADRMNTAAALFIGGAEAPGTHVTGYVRNQDGDAEGGLSYAGVIYSASPGAVLTIQAWCDLPQGTTSATVDGTTTSLTLCRLPSTLDYLRIREAGGGQNLSAAQSNTDFDTNDEVDAPYTRPGAASQISINITGDYLFTWSVSADKPIAEGTREHLWTRPSVNGSPLQYASAGNFIRGSQGTVNCPSAGGSLGTILELTAGDDVRLAQQNEATDANAVFTGGRYALQGIRIAPEMAIYGNGNEIADGDATPAASDDTEFGTVQVGVTNEHTFTVTNDLQAIGYLSLIGVPTVSVSGSGDFTVSVQPGSTNLEPGAATTFTIRFAPTSAGPLSAVVSITNNDTDESPYTFAVQGQGFVGNPEMGVWGDGIEITSGDTTPAVSDDTEFGAAQVGITNYHTFTITNTGPGSLSLTGAPVVAISGSGDFTISSQPGSTSLASGETTTFIVRFAPSGSGARSADISIANDDSDENPYTFRVGGTGTPPSPEMDVYGNGIEIIDGDTSPAPSDDTDFGTLQIGVTNTHMFTVTNTGLGALTLSGVPTVSISGSGDFTVSSQPGTTNLPPGGASTFTVRFAPTGSGPRTADISITSDDIDENPYTFRVGGSGTPPYAEMGVYGNGAEIADGDVTPSVADGTDFGAISTGATRQVVFTITNDVSGLLNLVLTADPAVSISGDSEFTISAQPGSTNLAPGAATTFTVQFAPLTIASFSATISIANTDTDENPYTFALQGSGISSGPEMSVLGNGVEITDGDATPTSSDNTDFGQLGVNFTGTVSHTFIITNSATTNLLITGTPVIDITGTHATDFATNGAAILTSVPGGGSTSFTIIFSPSGTGLRSATVSIDSNDGDENPYTFAIQGWGTVGHNADQGVQCANCHAHGLSSTYVPRGTDQDTRCKSCHNPAGSAASKSAIAMHGVGTNTVDCGSCHEIHNNPQPVSTDTHSGSVTATNLTRIRADMSKYVSGALTNTVFHSRPSHFAFAETNSPWNGVCQSCHTGTLYHTRTAGDHSHETGTVCTDCHSHQSGFAPSGGCIDCHKDPKGPGNYRREVDVEFGAGNHHVVGVAVTNTDCEVCHDQNSHKTFSGGVNVLLNDPDGGAAATYNGTGGSIETFCVNCHDFGGPTITNPPFSDGLTPTDIKTGWTGSRHDTQLAAESCLSCHGGPDSTRSGLSYYQNVHGAGDTNQLSLLVAGETKTGVEEDLCWACHDGAPSTLNAETPFAVSRTIQHPVRDADQTAGRAVECTDCHNPHEATGGAHTYSTEATSTRNQISGALTGVSGYQFNYGGLGNYAATANGNFTATNSVTYEYEVCFKCHSAKSWNFGAAPNGLSANGTQNPAPLTDVAREFNPNNRSGHPIVTGLNNYPNSATPKALVGAQMRSGTPWDTNLGTQTMKCSDCHNTDAASPAAQGPHGSASQFMLRGPNAGNWPNVTLSNIGTAWCVNCHVNNTGGNSAHSEADHSNRQCYLCHIVVPHGGKLGRLMTDNDGATPTRYFYNGSANSQGLDGYTKPATRNSYGESGQCEVNSGCYGGHDGTEESW